MKTLSARLFGRFCVHYGRQPITNLESHKEQELFAYLLLFHHRPHARENLADLLWSNKTAEQSRSYLRRVLWQLQTSMKEEIGEDADRILHIEGDWIEFNDQLDLWLDVDILEQAYKQTKGVSGSSLDEPVVKLLRQATSLYHSDLLEGWYQDWCLCERERLQQIYLGLLDKLMRHCLNRRQFEDGIAFGMSILRYDQARERTHRQLMRLRYLAGDRTGALRQFQRCAESLKNDLSVKPAQRTQALFKQIQADSLIGQTVATTAVSPEMIEETASLVQMLSCLEQIKADLVLMQSQVQGEIEAISQRLTMG